MARYTKENYQQMLYKLTPRGLAWPRDKFSNLYLFYLATAAELFVVSERALQLIEEADPRTTTELITDWERIVGIPDECQQPADTLERRRADVVARLTTLGSLSRQFFIDFAAYLGFTITIEEFRPFRVHYSSVGDALTNGDWVYTWRVHAPEETIKYFMSGISQAGDPLASWGNDFLECSLNKRKPAETIVLFAYGS